MKDRIEDIGSLSWPLMQNNVSRNDLDCLIEFLKQDDPILTQSSNVIAFEEEWSKWLGIKHSVYVNSGSSANLISLAVLKELNGLGEIIVPPLTWVSDIASVLQNGFTPVFADINPKNLCMDEKEIMKKISTKTKAVFLTYAQGFNGLTDNLLTHLAEKNIPLIEDVCESHGATHNGKKLGSYGLISNFSFYYAHHMTTIEGGMVCTNNENIYQKLRMFRSHGMVREISDESLKAEFLKNTNQLNPEFIFAFPAYNVRNTEIGAIIGRNQLKRINENIEKRILNNKLFLENLDPAIFRTDLNLKGSSNYAFNFILKEPNFIKRDLIEAKLKKASVEFRRGSAGGGNQLRQPYLSHLIKNKEWEKYPQVEHIHHFGWYVGNYPSLEQEKILKLCKLLNQS